MSGTDEKSESEKPIILYQIRIKGYLESDWSDWFEGMEVKPDKNGETVLTGPVFDQPALHGILKKIRDLGIPLLSVNPIVNNQGACENTTLNHSDVSYKSEKR